MTTAQPNDQNPAPTQEGLPQAESKSFDLRLETIGRAHDHLNNAFRAQALYGNHAIYVDYASSEVMIADDTEIELVTILLTPDGEPLIHGKEDSTEHLYLQFSRFNTIGEEYQGEDHAPDGGPPIIADIVTVEHHKQKGRQSTYTLEPKGITAHEKNTSVFNKLFDILAGRNRERLSIRREEELAKRYHELVKKFRLAPHKPLPF